MPGITLLGLGPGDPMLLTREAWQLLSSASVVWLRTRQHPVVSALPDTLVVQSFDDVYDAGDSFEGVYASIVDTVLELGKGPDGVIYGIPGHPLVAEVTGQQILKRAQSDGIPLRVVEGLSFLEPTFTALGIDPYPHITLCDALSLGAEHLPPFPPDIAVLIAQLYSRVIAAEVKSTLTTIYPDTHPVKLVHAAGTEQQLVEHLQLYQIDRSLHLGALSALYVPPLEAGTSLEALQEVVAHLRSPEGCPWDREQTHDSLRRHLLEESYEAIEAVDSADPMAMKEEFGDLLLQIMLNAQIAGEAGEFTLNDLSKGIYDKIIRRHPHVFGDLKIDGVEEVLANWERLKEGERDLKPASGGVLDGVPVALPALSQAQEYQERAARVGFDWPEIGGVLEKVAEEVQEVRAAADSTELVSELGDLLFSLVNLARWKDVDAESALRGTNQKFRRRFGFLERQSRERQRSLSDLTLDEMESLWQQAKLEEDQSARGLDGMVT